LRQIVTGGAQALLNAYHESKLARRVMDHLGLPRLITQSPFFYLPSAAIQKSLLAALPVVYPCVLAPSPVLIEMWQGERGRQIHLVNYAATGQNVQVQLGPAVLSAAALNAEYSGSVVSPDDEQAGAFVGNQVALTLDVYKILLPNLP
jgi:hypothetical protein